MQISYPSLDQLVTEQFSDVYRLCFLLTAGSSDAWQTAFQTFLYMGAQKEPFADRTAEQDALFSFCIRTCTDYYYRKLRRRRRDRLEKETPFPVSDRLWELLGMPLRKKASVFFTDFLGLAPERTAYILSEKAARPAAKDIPDSTPDGGPGSEPDSTPGGGPDEAWREAIASILPAEDGAAQMLSEIYLRFGERNVPLENKLRNIRFWCDRAVIWIALAIILLFAAAAWYTAGLGV